MKDGFRRHVATVGGLTAVSRVLGFVRDMIMAWLLGAGLLADAFVVAFRIPNLLRRFMAEGAVSVAFVPVFSEVKEREGLARAFRMAQQVLGLTFAALAAVVVAGEILAPLLVGLIAPGFLHSGVFDVTVHLTRIMFPFILLIGIAALLMGVLNSLGHFAMPAAAPIIMNVFMIGVPLVLHVAYPLITSAADALAWGVVSGGIAQILVQIPPLRKRGVPLKVLWDLHSPRVRQVVRLMGVAAVGASIYQINVLVGTLLASLLPQGSVSYLYYSNRILELPLGIFAFAVGNVMLPSMSSASARMDAEGFSALMGKGVLAVLLFTIPATMGIMVLARPIFSVLFMRGAFTNADVLGSAYALQMYALSLWAIGYTRIQTQALYSMQKAKIVVNISWISLGVNILGCIVLMRFMQHAGIALASSCAVLVQLAIQHRYIAHMGVRLSADHRSQVVKMLVASLIMGAALIPLARMDVWAHGFTLSSASVLSAGVFLGIALYFGLLWVMGVRGGLVGHTRP
ncbi:MAG TPA: murein biosynthesis integral membrane protein MurJ [Deltaproteobacteria bacterium]|nr:murein biosynthesis integral membrane protein MurJ [Deltaproteobacteria bacterium]HQI81382.1 murein biosynthesis integral membrane protein MurJ [Deltaproteobacteria bacterium]